MAERVVPSEELVRELVGRALDRHAASEATTPTTAQDAPAHNATRGGERTVAIGADHGGYPLKEALAKALAERGYTVTDCGTTSTEAVDYPDFAYAVAQLVAGGECTYGIVVDGAGIGSAMVANKVPGVRAANAYDISMARNAREHNYANVLTLGGRMIGEGLALEIVDTFLATPWGAERHGNRVAKITAIEQQYLRSRPEDQPT
ncbi:MAG TPA: ribose 5-phosphate isomerase B [Candidatus Deferrimicrobiaceae bacterium]|nr:ribose 5-phosphate isomerase B [Candidatus Deferrimicrobiaceae bacterium]